MLQYDKTSSQSYSHSNLKEIQKNINEAQVNWINIDSLHDVDLIAEIGSCFNIHNLTLEDIVHVGHQPKMEEYEGYLFFTLKMIQPGKEDNNFKIEHISFILYKETLISFQEDIGDPFHYIRERIKLGKGKARGRGPDYLLFLLIDAIVDQYLLSIEVVNKQVNDLEMEILENPNEGVVAKIIEQKKLISALRKIIIPARDALKEIALEETEFISEEFFNYFNDVFGHIKNIVDHLDTQRETLTSLMEFHIAQISTQMNKVMQSLTIIATIFIPLTFLAGIYGMNFQFMPELAWKWSYPILLILMLITGITMYLYMRRKKWF